MRLSPAHIIIVLATAILFFPSCTNDKKSPTDSGPEIPPAAPSDLVATAKSGSQIGLSWKDASTNEKLFRIERKETDGKFTEIATVPANVVMYVATDLKMDVAYTFRVRANNAAGNSEYSSEITVKTMNIPLAPSGLAVTTISTSSIDLAWEDNSGDEQGFRIERREGNGSYSVLATVSGDVKLYSVTGLLSEKEYTFRVCSYNGAGNSDFSNEVMVSTIHIPPAPSSLNAASISSSSIDLTWTDNSDNEQGFRIERREGNGSYSVEGAVSANVKEYSATGLLPDTEYTFRVCAYTVAVNSEYSNEATVKTKIFPAPANLSAAVVSSSQIDLAWKDNSDDEQGFRIERKQGDGAWVEIGRVSANVTVYSATGLVPDTEYVFRVRAYNGIFYSEYSEEKTAMTPIVVQGVTLAPIPAGSFSMGSTSGYPDETPVHTVTLTAFEMSIYEITQGQYKAVMGSNPSNFTGGSNLPVEQVTWWDAINFCNALSSKSGLQPCYDVSSFTCDFSKNGFRLPTEAEWEYACRAGSTTNYSPGDAESDLARTGWYDANSGNKTHPVGQKSMNSWGMYDMHGNVFEWCNDWYERYTEESVTDPTGPLTGSFRVVRGGNWSYDSSFCRSARRYHSYQSNYAYIIGFRVVRRISVQN